MPAETPEQFAASLIRAAGAAHTGAIAATREAAKAVKADWQQSWRGIRSKRNIYRAITYQTHMRAGEIEAEVGVIPSATQKLGGSFAHIIEFGSASGNAPRNDGGQALLRHADAYTTELATLAAGLLALGGAGVGTSVSLRDEARFNVPE